MMQTETSALDMLKMKMTQGAKKPIQKASTEKEIASAMVRLN
jgi:hypothetical protein